MDQAALIDSRMGIGLLLFYFLIMGSGCSTTTRTFSEDEVKLIPSISINRVLATSSTEKVKIRSRSANGSLYVDRMDGPDHVLVNASEGGRMLRISVEDILSIKRIRNLENQSDFEGNNSAAVIGEVAIMAPLIPLGMLMAATPLDAQKYDADEEKASLAYHGLTKEALMQHVGTPDEKFYLTDTNDIIKSEVWHYSRGQVLKGGRYLFLTLPQGKVYHNAAVIWDKDKLTPIEEQD